MIALGSCHYGWCSYGDPKIKFGCLLLMLLMSQVAANTEAPGLAAEEAEQLITYPIEAVMYALPDVDQVRSISKTGLSGVTVVFKEGTDTYCKTTRLFGRLLAAKEPRYQKVLGHPKWDQPPLGWAKHFSIFLFQIKVQVMMLWRASKLLTIGLLSHSPCLSMESLMYYLSWW